LRFFFFRLAASALSRTGQRRQRDFESQHFFFGLSFLVALDTTVL
jgi:hypothetical protein